VTKEEEEEEEDASPRDEPPLPVTGRVYDSLYRGCRMESLCESTGK